MVKGKLERKYKLIHDGRALSKGWLSEAGKADAFQLRVQRLPYHTLYLYFRMP